MTARSSLRMLVVALITCTTLLAAGLFAPCMTILPGFGELDSIVRTLRPGLAAPSSFSIAEGIWLMYAEGRFAIASIVLTFSVFFPLAKLTVLWKALLDLYAGSTSSATLLGLLHKVGRLSMLDVLVLALIVVAIKGLPGGTAVRLEWGVFAFAASVLLSIWLAERIEHFEPSCASKG